MSVFSDISGLFAPALCHACRRTLGDGERLLCTACRIGIPLTGYPAAVDNPVAQKFWGLIPIVNASSLYFYSPSGSYHGLVHDFKYRGAWRAASDAGHWLGASLRESGLYDGVEVVVPVPLHVRKFLRRGYNQSRYIAQGVAAELGCGCDHRSVARVVHTQSQTSKNRRERWENVEAAFAVRDAESLRGRHVLIVDDVLTTGATIVSLAQALLMATGHDVRISIATLAVSKANLKTF